MSVNDYGTEYLVTVLQAYSLLDRSKMTKNQMEAVDERTAIIQAELHHRTFNLTLRESPLAVDVKPESDWVWVQE